MFLLLSPGNCVTEKRFQQKIVQMDKFPLQEKAKKRLNISMMSIHLKKTKKTSVGDTKIVHTCSTYTRRKPQEHILCRTSFSIRAGMLSGTDHVTMN